MQKRRFPTAYPTFVYWQTIRHDYKLFLMQRQTIRRDYKLFLVQRQTIRRDYKLFLMQRRTIRHDYKFILCSGKLFAATINSFCAAANYSPRL